MVTFLPSLITLALGADNFFKLSNELSAFLDWVTPKIAFKITTINIIIDSTNSPKKICTTAAAIRIITNGSAKFSKNIFHKGVFLPSVSSLYPSAFSLEAASLLLSPFLLVSSSLKTCSISFL